MYSFLNQIRNYIWLKSIAYIVFGLFFLFDPHGTLNIAINLIAAFFIVFGVINLISAWRQRSNNEVTDYSLAIGITQLIIAVIVFLLAEPLLSFLPFILGIVLVITGVSNVFTALNHRQYVNVSPMPFVLYGILLILVGILLAFNPFGTVLVLLQIFGATMVVMAIMEIVTSWKLGI
ncbi:DUF308 domain-containing protein [Lentilactobacillus otakiensis]|uniref:DUF308 domain-containing protein n=1 Tax=Lentilactobacillus otakiensis TaxID=481720 RepID=UPI00042A62D4|nr:DUF308 domain-containing protein [Lentilactobacillus otakiensis]KRL12063.1 hypothetical protein FD05_GL001894 [Lentilactobacillus otakiensis DSM 19908 = JCM 15040]MBZ3777508.1 DUF308 domain-containing protein [Lentilactobacillus otakiensis]MDV3517403.1 DUF308 domain-containing protein [Lentilactobacillus otakiensis]